MDFKVLAIKRHCIETDGNGITTLIGLSNCPLKCKYCLNKNKIEKNEFKTYTVDELINEIMIDYCYFIATNGGVTFGGAEPLLYSEAIYEFIQKLPNGINVNIETSLNVSEELIKTIAPFITCFIIDIKTMDKEIYKNYTGKENDYVLSNLKYLSKTYPDKCKIRLPLIPNFNNNEDIKKSKEILENMGFKQFDIFKYKIRG